MRNLFAWKIATLIAICGWLWLTFSATEPAPDWHKGELFVAMPPDGMDVETAFELELVTLFAQRLHLKPKPQAMDYGQIANALTAHKVHMAAAGLRSSEKFALRFSTPYQTLNEQAVCKDRTPRRLSDLAERNLAVVAASAQAEALRDIAKRIPELHWAERDGQPVSSLLQEVAEGSLDCTVANEEQIALARNFYPQLDGALDLNSPSHLAWLFAADADTELFDAARDFFETIKRDGTLSHLIDRHYGHNERLEAVDAVAFVNKTHTVLPQYKSWFEEAEALTGIDWQLLAALAYQESHWDPLATSYTNVRGMMMLTQDTAERMDVADRLDARASIIAGAKYLHLLKESLPERINDRERTWMAMAAYNQGMGHLEDARVLTAKAGLNPDVWSDVRKMMPLLSRPAYFEQTKHGQARGGEAVILVETVRLYHDILNRLEQAELMRLPPNLAVLMQYKKKFNP
ncbi:MAG: membrane-bound lytic murein transglycosylase MltF [Gallionellaceae bacterium]|nr:MAG: membrane-bound lytic murein transglycosylase MltF [Gallionellaceae bacterium]